MKRPRLVARRGAGEAMKALLLGFLALLVGLGPAVAAEKGTVGRGELLLRENCSRCHAIGKEGNSPHPEAPTFRTLSSRYPIEDLSESLAEGIVSGNLTCRSSCSAPKTSRQSSITCNRSRRSLSQSSPRNSYSTVPSGHISQSRAASISPREKCSTSQRMKGATRLDQR